MNTILASASRRRQDLLASLGISPGILIPSIDESVGIGESVDEFIRRICLEKVKNIYQDEFKDSLIISSDTIVYLDNQIIGKPQNREEAENILGILSSRTHQVITGINLRYNNRDLCKIAKTGVSFDPLSRSEIRFYLDSEDYLDKAGAYAIQGLASTFINKIEGCYFNVMGFSLNLFYKMLKEMQLNLKDLIHTH
jgi:septum formation protein